MTDSGFSSAASQRSTSSIIRPGHINSFSGSLKSDLFNMPSCSEEKENIGSVDDSIPTPCMQFPTNCGRPVIPNRLLYGKNHGGYSPGLSPFSNHEMSPMSSLAYDFRDLNTSHNSSATPRKRLSLSSVSSLDSPHLSNSSFLGSINNLSHASPAPSSIGSNVNSPYLSSLVDDGIPGGIKQDLRRGLLKRRHEDSLSKESATGRQQYIANHQLMDSQDDILRSTSETQRFRPITEEACFPETPTPTKSCEAGDAIRENTLRVPDEKLPLYRRFKSMPSSKARFRLHGVQEKPESEKENSEPSVMRFTRHRSSGPNMASPLGLSDNFSPIGTNKTFSRPGTYHMMSSPLVSAFSHVSSSAFKPVSPNEAASQSKRRVLGDIAVNIPVPTHSPIQSTKTGGGVKRLLNESATNTSVNVARKRKCSRSLNAKTAFAHDRKTKSADAIISGRPMPTFTSSSPVSNHSMYRPISAPVLMADDDDDYVLSHSSLCSHDSDDEESRRNLSEDDFNSVSMTSSCKDDDIENMMCENILRDNKIRGATNVADISTGTPVGLDGLISGPLIFSTSTNSSFTIGDANDSITGLLTMSSRTKKEEIDPALRPRELFRSPSAPPLIPSRRALMNLKRSGRQCGQSSFEGTPVSIKRPRTFASDSDVQDVESKENAIPDPCLNRSKSYNDVDVMRAVDLGCEDASLTGDFSRACTLPTVQGRKQDLKYITPQTLVEVLSDEHNVGMVEVIDCRYTYEYEGGHVDGAVNIWTEEQLVERFFNLDKPMWATSKQQQHAAGADAKPHILVFHCEFSSERGPRLARYLRNYDRAMNVYPKLHYPEVYVLKDGYKEFYRQMKDHCEPRSYVPMSHEAYASELRKFRIKSKTWAGERSKHGLCNRLKN